MVGRRELVARGVVASLSLYPERVEVIRVSRNGPRDVPDVPDVPDVLVYDLDELLPVAEADLRRRIDWGAPVVGLVGDQHAATAARARELGVASTVSLAVTAGDLLHVITVAGGAHLSHTAGHHGVAAARDASALSPREEQILRAIAAGLTNEQISRDLHLSINTVKTYIRTAYQKIGVNSRSQAILWAIRNEVTHPLHELV